jgi:hypothetical protein
MTGAIAMGTSKITGLGNPTSAQDAATKTYVDTADALKLNLTGGTMSGAIAMGTNKITGVGNPTLAQDAATKDYVDDILGSATSAATSAAAASASASAASTSASNASNSADAAAGSAAAAAASYDAFDDRYLGDKASDPTLDNDGNALLTGALYFNTTSDVMKVYDGSAWNIAAISSASPTFTGTVTADGLSLGDNEKATFGAGNDLEIYHDGTHSFIHNYTGNIQLETFSDDRDIFIKSDDGAGGSATYLQVDGSTGSINLRHYGDLKLATTATGIDVTGTATMDGLTVDGNATLSSTGSVTLTLAADTDNITETDVPTIIMSQDNNLTNVYFGIEGIADTAFSGSVANYPYIKSTSALQIATSSSPTALFDYNGDISFYEDTGTTPKFVWDASAESLGIGTSPNTALQVSSAVTTKSVVETTGASSDALIEFTRGQGSGNTWSIGLDQSNSSALSFAYLASGSPSLTSHGKVTINSSGSVGIGTASPAAFGTRGIQIGAYGLTLSDRVGYQSMLGNNLYHDGTNDRYIVGAGATAFVQSLGSSLWFKAPTGTAGAIATLTQAMTLDSSGNLLVGKTNTTSTTAGTHLNPNGKITTTRSGGPSAAFVRLTSDGSIVDFQREGSTVGSIGTVDGDLNVFAAASGHKGLRFGNGFIAPTSNSTTGEDNAVDLGLYTTRFKDLYLSGGVYLGGTVAANLLDDYEEGTWTPAFTNLTIGNGTQSHIYTKVGNKVTLEGTITLGSTSSISGALNDASVPFTANTTQRAFNKCYFLDNGTANYVGTAVVNDLNVLQLLADNAASTYLTFSNLSSTVPFTWTSTDIIRYSITYITT